MSDRTILLAAAIIALGLVLGGFVGNGRYSIVSVAGGAYAFVLDRWTGTLIYCTNTDCWRPKPRPEP